MSLKNIYALSTLKADTNLLREGLIQKGIIGYIEKAQNRVASFTNLNAFRITYKNGIDFLYTVDVTQEKLVNLEYSNEGSIGFCYRVRLPNTLRLYRFFHKETLSHLQVTKPDINDLLAKGFRDETEGRPIYLHEFPSIERSEVYFYTNTDFVPTGIPSIPKNSIRSEHFNIDDAIREFNEIISDNNLSLDAFTFTKDSTAITVFVSDTVHNFYLNLQANKEYFTIRANPALTQHDYIINDVSTWNNVIIEFQAWVDSIKLRIPVTTTSTTTATTTTPPLEINAKSQKYFETASNYEFRSNNIAPVLKVESQADIFVKLLNSFKENETGLLLGIFGRWGRGKTYFWNQVKIKLSQETQKIYRTVEFHAWKYQDTPASWAYRYEQCATQFFNEPRQFIFNFSFFNRVRLNFKRLGKWNFIISVAWLLIMLIWTVFASWQLKWSIIFSFISSIPIGLILSLWFYYQQFSGKAKNLFQAYFTETSFKELLGIQAEMHNELKTLFEVWIGQKDIGKKKVILFVDDIDRCNEERIIQVIDSLKIMIDDPSISDRLTVVAAIDEDVLKRAIKRKYHNSVIKDKTIENRNITIERLCREYMDKLFISGFKLAPLSAKDNEELFLSLVKEKVQAVERTEAVNSSLDDVPSDSASIPPEEIPTTNSSTGFNISSKLSQSRNEENFELTVEEEKMLLKAIRNFTDSTPRAIRIFYYRYHLAKYFKDLFIQPESTLYKEWNDDQTRKSVLPTLIIHYAIHRSHNDLRKEIQTNEKSSSQTASISLSEETFTMSRELYIELLKVVEIVVPY